MRSPTGWIDAGQTPEFKEITYVISGELHVEHQEGLLKVKSGQIVVTEPNEWIKYYNCSKDLEYQERKRWLKEKAKSLYPNLNVTLMTADSILIAYYAMREHFKDKD